MEPTVEEALDKALRKTLHIGQSSLQSVVYIVLEQVMVDMFRKDSIGEALDARIAKLFDTNEAVQVF